MQNKYILRYPGGKYKLAKKIIDMFPQHRIYVEVFGGAAHVLLQKEKSKIEVYNDIDGNLVHLFRVARDRPDELQEFLNMTPYSREIYNEAVNIYRSGKLNELDDIRRAAYYFILINMSFAGIITGSWGYEKVVRNIPVTYFNKVDRIRLFAERFKNVYIENDDFENVIKRWDSKDTLFYCDPPYFRAEEYYTNGNFSISDHERLAKALENISGMFVLSYNDCEWVRNRYSKFYIHELNRPNSMFYRRGDSGKPDYRELIITNYDVTTVRKHRNNSLYDLLGGDGT